MIALLRFWPFLIGGAAIIAALTLYAVQLRGQLSDANETIDAWERINEADISSGDSIADRSWLLNRAK